VVQTTSWGTAALWRGFGNYCGSYFDRNYVKFVYSGLESQAKMFWPNVVAMQFASDMASEFFIAADTALKSRGL